MRGIPFAQAIAMVFTVSLILGEVLSLAAAQSFSASPIKKADYDGWWSAKHDPERFAVFPDGMLVHSFFIAYVFAHYFAISSPLTLLCACALPCVLLPANSSFEDYLFPQPLVFPYSALGAASLVELCFLPLSELPDYCYIILGCYLYLISVGVWSIYKFLSVEVLGAMSRTSIGRLFGIPEKDR